MRSKELVAQGRGGFPRRRAGLRSLPPVRSAALRGTRGFLSGTGRLSGGHSKMLRWACTALVTIGWSSSAEQVFGEESTLFSQRSALRPAGRSRLPRWRGAARAPLISEVTWMLSRTSQGVALLHEMRPRAPRSPERYRPQGAERLCGRFPAPPRLARRRRWR